MKRVAISLAEIAEYENLALALQKAAKGKRYRADVIRFMQQVEVNLNRLGCDIRAGLLPYGRFRIFSILDPKPRVIHAACFEDRVFHHALMNLAGGVLERAMLPSSYACRPNKGVHKAVKQVQCYLQRYAYYGKIDIQGYFASIPHHSLLQVLQARFKGGALLAQFQRVLASYRVDVLPEMRGLPIGSLTSQYFANYYLDGLDRLLDGLPAVRAHIRYMDDIMWWCDYPEQVVWVLAVVEHYLAEQRGLLIKPNQQLQPSVQGVTYCGFRIMRGAVRLSRRRKRQFRQRRQYWEWQYQQGVINAHQLQLASSAVHAITDHTDSLLWRRKNLQRHPPLDV